MTIDRAQELRNLVPWSREWLRPLRAELLSGLGLGQSAVVASLGHSPEGYRLRYDDDSVDAVVCEHLLMWATVPGRVIDEMHRVLVPGGHALFVAEPDYSGLIEHPDDASIQGLVAGVLRKHGADPDIGQQMRSLFDRDCWDVTIRIHQPDPIASPSGELLETMISQVTQVLEDEVPEQVVTRWVREVRKADQDGTLFVWVPHFAVRARKH